MQPQPKLGPWREELERLLAANATRSSRERLTLMRLFEELGELGYGGGYDAVQRYAARWRRRQLCALQRSRRGRLVSQWATGKRAPSAEQLSALRELIRRTNDDPGGTIDLVTDKVPPK